MRAELPFRRNLPTTPASGPAEWIDGWPLAISSASFLVAAVIVSWVTVFPLNSAPFLFDIESYRRTLDGVVAGDLMYVWLGYPPFALILLSPLRGLPQLAGYQLWTGLSIMLVLILAAVLLRLTAPAPGPRSLPRRIALFGMVGGLLLLSAPVLMQLACGQVTLIVAFLAFVDAAGAIAKRYRGSLVGLGAAIKLTPLFFFPHYLINRQWREFFVAVASFGTATAIGFLLFPADSLYFWLHTDSSDRLEPGRVDNMSILGFLNRWLGDPVLAKQWWLVAALVVGIAAYLRARGHSRRGERVQAALVLGCASVVISPVAWIHYDVWLVLTAVWLILSGIPRARMLGALIYFVYSLAFPALIGALAATNGLDRVVWELFVLTPVLIATLGLPHRRDVSDETVLTADVASA